jgi:outer membrane receptor protein involved in Fe transport
LTVALAAPASAQLLYGSIVGTVEDQSGAVVPNATVSILSKTTGLTRETKADEVGRYSLLNVPAGSYEMKVSAPGFRTVTREAVEVSINSVTRTDMKLEVGQVSEQVTVAASAVTLQTDKSEVRTEIASQQITSMPLPGYRNYQWLINLAPGTSPSAYQNAEVDTPGRALRTFVNGTATNNNNTLTDGALNINVWLPHHVAYVQPSESIDTVNVSTNAFDAEQGMAGGAAVTLVTKSGTNALHGVAFEFHNNQHLNTAPYYRTANYVLPLSIKNMFGGTLGGPIKKDKLFYFVSYEGLRDRAGSTSYLSTAPADFRNGDFSKWTSYATVYDPATAPASNAAARTPFPNNTVPQNRWNSIFPNVYKSIPLPNTTSITDPNNLAGNYAFSGVRTLDRNQYDTKVNYVATPKLAIWGKYSRMHAPVQGVYPFGELGGSPIGTEGQGDTTTQLATAGYNYTFSPTFLMDGIFGYTRMDQYVGIPGVDKNYGLDIWKIPGTNGGKQYAGDPRYGGAPVVEGFGFSYVGMGATWTPVWRAERAYTYQTNFTRVKGAHEIRWGFEARRLHMDHWQPETQNPRGDIVFSSGTTNIPGKTAREPNNYASALLGLVNTYNKSIQYYTMQTREWQFAFYARDRWQLSRRLTLNLGLRYEYYPLINRGDRGIERWDPATNIVYFGGLGGTPMNNGIEVSKKLFSPRVGFAYRAGDAWVIRAGYGLSYDPLPFSRPLRGLYPATLTGSWVPTVSTYGWYNSIDQGIPDIPTPDVSKGSAQLPLNIDMGPRSPWGGMLHRGYIQSWNFTVERRLPFDMVGSVGYVATRTIHQLIDLNINTVGPGLGTTTANLPLAKAYGRTIAANMWDGIGYASYNSLQSALTKNYSKGLMLKAAYTYGKALNMADEDGWTSLRAFNWGPMVARNYTPAGYDRTHAFTMGWVYELPFGKNQLVKLSGPADYVFGGWRFTGMFSAYTGLPFTVTGSGSSLMCTGCSQTGEQLGPVIKLDKKGPQQPYFEPSSFRDPLYWFSQTGVYKPGSMGYNSLRGPGYWRMNPGLYKNFKITERINAEFRAEADNLAHNTLWSNPSGSSANMRLNADGSLNTSVANPLNGFMTITGADSTRNFRFGLRVAF